MKQTMKQATVIDMIVIR